MNKEFKTSKTGKFAVIDFASSKGNGDHPMRLQSFFLTRQDLHLSILPYFIPDQYNLQTMLYTVNHVTSAAPEAHTTAEKEHKQRGSLILVSSPIFHEFSAQLEFLSTLFSPTTMSNQPTRRVEIAWHLQVLLVDPLKDLLLLPS